MTEWWENPPFSSTEGFKGSDIDPECIVNAVENMEAQSLADPLPPRASGGLGFTAFARAMFAPAFEKVYKKRREEESAKRGEAEPPAA